jgi:2-octaprenyl-6-methoxyphenol hydroxylase
VSQKGGPGRTLIRASEQGLPALGYTVAFSRLQAALDERIASTGATVHYGCACEEILLEPEAATIRFASGDPVRAKLLVLADGGANARKIPGIAFHERDYAQVAVVAALHADRAHGGLAYERFTPGGPVALLPVDDRYALVWTTSPAEAERLLGLDEGVFLQELQAHFGDRAGRFTAVANRASFPLRLRAVNSSIALRTVIVGNAAQALHPIAGQGLNLGLRDARDLAAAIVTGPRETIGATAMLTAYRDARRRDATRGIAFTDFLVSAFALKGALPRLGRGLALAALDLFPPARRALAARMIYGASE